MCWFLAIAPVSVSVFFTISIMPISVDLCWCHYYGICRCFAGSDRIVRHVQITYVSTNCSSVQKLRKYSKQHWYFLSISTMGLYWSQSFYCPFSIQTARKVASRVKACLNLGEVISSLRHVCYNSSLWICLPCVCYRSVIPGNSYKWWYIKVT